MTKRTKGGTDGLASVRKILALATAILILIIGAWYVGSWLPAAKANNLLRIGLRLMEPELELTQELRAELGLPDEIRTRSRAVEYFLVKAATVDESRYYGSYLILGKFLLEEDCSAAANYLQRYLEFNADPEAQAILDEAVESGCKASGEAAQK